MLRHLLLCFLLAGLTAHAQNGDKKDGTGEKQIDRVPPEKIPPAPVLKPDEALKSFKLQPGFKIEVVASEPLVHDPVAIAFDADGRIWVAEMTGYMRTYEGKGEREPVGNIAVLEDTDADGKMDKRTEFLTGLMMPRAVSPVRGGVLVAEPPNLWFCRDTNGDLKCDEKVLVLKDYGDTTNPEHTANGLIWALDNWIYSADWTTRIKSLPDEWKREPTAFRGQWGISQDDYGRLVYNSNSDQFRMDLVPAHYLQRNPNFRGALGVNVDPIHDQSTYPARVTPGVNRGYREGTLRPDGTLAKFTAACAPLIYRGENFPAEFYGNAFICEPSANLIKRNVLIETNGEVRGWQAYTNAEFLASTDERFRPVNLNNGPDGALYIVDLYRGVIQHKIFLTTYLRRQSESRKLEAPINLGRIYRVVHEGKPLKPAPKLAKAAATNLIAQLSSPNGWVRDTAQRLLVERADSDTITPLKLLAAKGSNELAQIHAMWTLDGIGGFDVPTLFACLHSTNGKVRATAVRLSEPFFKSEDWQDVLMELLLYQTDRSPDVQLQMSLTLGEISDGRADAAMANMAHNNDNIYIRDALLSGLYNRELRTLEWIMPNRNWSQPPRGDKFLRGLGQCILTEKKPDRVNKFFELAATAKPWQRAALLEGALATAPETKSKSAPKIKPVRFAEEPTGFKKLSALTDAETKAYVAKLTPLIAWPGQPNYVPPPVLKPLTADEQQRFTAGKDLFSSTCAACHQLTGLGMEGLAPPLAESEWVNGSDQRLARIILNGVKGPIEVKGRKFELEMPGLPFFTDDQIASVLTYIRREWENTGDPVSPDMVKQVRAEIANRSEAWSAAELQKIK